MANYGGGAGNGPSCPANPLHGRLYSRDRGGDPTKGWRCMHQDHGGNGRAFTDLEVRNYEMGDTDMAAIIENAAKSVVNGTLDIDSAVAQVAKATKRSQAQVRELLTDAVAVLKAQADEKAAAAAEAKEAKVAEKTKAPKEPKEPKAPRVKQEHVEPAEFAAVRDRLGMSNKEVSYALKIAGQGCTLSRVTELTHSKGSSANLFAKYTEALETWRAANPAAQPAE